jgi:UDP-N-acetylmuramoyl-L-alanyl-D-glutamate--2,6-diaminopimelate ligase
MEVSSHGLELHRVDATRFAAAVFTNLSQDHLDFHPTMEDYFAAKSRLFTPAFTDHAVVCADDPWGRRLLAALESRGELALHPYGLSDAQRRRARAHRRVVPLAGREGRPGAAPAGSTWPTRSGPPPAPRPGPGAAGDRHGLSAAPPVPGRFETVSAGQGYTVIVDYSHKPDALEQALHAARELVSLMGASRLSSVAAGTATPPSARSWGSWPSASPTGSCSHPTTRARRIRWPSSTTCTRACPPPRRSRSTPTAAVPSPRL